MTEQQTEGMQNSDQVEIIYYTDPLCCWSWAFEPQWRRLRYEFSGKVRWQYRMGGLIPDIRKFEDPINGVSKPLQMGPIWMEAKHLSGMPIHDRIWFENPPNSSYPACIAVKCAELQSPEAAEIYLRRLREAVMLEGRNIARTEELKAIANKLEEEHSKLFNTKQFINDFQNNAGLEAFKQDVKEAREHNIGRFPALVFRKPGEPGVLIVGYRPYDVLLKAFAQVAPDLKPVPAKDAEDYKTYWGSLIGRELEEALAFVNNES